MAAYKVALIIDNLEGIGRFQSAVWQGVSDFFKNVNGSLFTYCAGTLGDTDYDDYNKYKNFGYDLIDIENFNGFIFSGGTMGNNIPINEYKNFLQRFSRKPCISIGSTADLYPEFISDNEAGMQDILNHLIDKHNYKHIAFVTGAEGNEDADKRFDTYKKALKSSKIPINEDFIYHGNWTKESGAAAVKTFLDERKIKPEVIVCSNDLMAIGVLKELDKRRISVPYDIAVTGFDDIDDSSAVLPALTTVKQPIYKLGQLAAENLINLIENKVIPHKNILSAEPKFRQSCGCVISIHNSKTSYSENSKPLLDPDIIKKNCYSIINEVQSTFKSMKEEKLIATYKAFFAEILENEGGIFLDSLSRSLRDSFIAFDDIRSWQYIVTELRKILYANNLENKQIQTGEDLLHIARVHINEASVQLQKRIKMKDRDKTNKILQISGNITTSFTLEDLGINFKKLLPEIDVPAAFICLFENKRDLETATLYVNYDEATDWKFSDSERVFPSKNILPESYFREKNNIKLIIYPICFRSNQLGYMVFEQKTLDGVVYENIMSQMHNTIQRIELLDSFQQAEAEQIKRSFAIEQLMEPMMEAIEYVKSLSIKQNEEIQNMNNRGEESKKHLAESSSITENLTSMTKETTVLVKVIDDISETINLVALNASIEAAHAGKFGAGFSVIAGEIRKLSDATKRNSKQIGNFLTNITKGISSLSDANNDTENAFSDLLKQINEVTNLLKDVSEKMKDLSNSGTSVLEVMNQ